MILDLETLKTYPTVPKIVNLHQASKRELKGLLLSKEEVEKQEKDPAWVITLSQGPDANYCDHCYVYESVLFELIAKGIKS